MPPDINSQLDTSTSMEPKAPVDVDEIKILLKTILLLWKKKYWILLGTLLCSGLGVIYALLAEPMYTSKAIIAPNEADKSGGLMSQIGGGLGGIMAASLGIGGTSLDRLAIIAKSGDVAESLIVKNNLLPRLFHKKYNFKEDRWAVTDSQEIPSVKHGILELTDNVLTISADLKKNVITMKIETYDSTFSQQLVKLYIDAIDRKLKNDVIEESLEKQRYLNKQLLNTADPWMVQKIQNLIGIEVEKTAMVVGSAIDVLDSPLVPLYKSKPKRSLIVASVLVAGFIMSSVLVLVFANVRNLKTIINSVK